MRSGFVSIVGRPNVGKSTLLNTILDRKIAIVSDKAQTTRNNIMGIYHEDDAEIIFIDTPGIHKPKHNLGKALNSKAYYSINDVDIILLVVDISLNLGPGDKFVIDKLKDMTGKEFHTAREADKKGLKNAFSYLISLAAATLIAKRIIVPFIATPLADKTKAWMSRNDKPVATHKDTKNTYNTEKPAATIENKEKNEDKNTQFAGNNTQNKTTNLLDEVKNQK